MPTGLLFEWLHFAFHLYFVKIFSMHILDAIMSFTMYIRFKDIKANWIVLIIVQSHDNATRIPFHMYMCVVDVMLCPGAVHVPMSGRGGNGQVPRGHSARQVGGFRTTVTKLPL